MSEPKSEVKSDLNRGFSPLHTLRGELRVRLHLAGLSAKDEWNKLEPHLASVEQAARELKETSRKALFEAVKSLERVRHRLAEDSLFRRGASSPPGAAAPDASSSASADERGAPRP